MFTEIDHLKIKYLVENSKAKSIQKFCREAIQEKLNKLGIR